MPYKDKNKHREYQRRRKRRKKRILQRYKRWQGCANCGYNKCGAALSFHHLRDKEHEIVNLAACSKYRLKKEIAKCIVLCMNCHMEHHYGLIV